MDNAVVTISNAINSLDPDTEYNLSDAISCVVTEMANETFELVLTYPIIGENYNYIQNAAILHCRPNNIWAAEEFFIYSISKPINGVITVNAEHIAYRMVDTACRGDIPIADMGYPSHADTVSMMMAYLQYECGRQHTVFGAPSISSDITDDIKVDWQYDAPVNGRTVMADAVKLFGGIWELHHNALVLKANRGTDRGFTVQYGVNMTNMNLGVSLTNRYTHIYPYWRGEVRTDYTDESGTQRQEIQTHTVNGELVSIYHAVITDDPYTKTYIYDCSDLFDEEPTNAELTAEAVKFMQSAEGAEVLGKYNQTLTVSFVHLGQTAEYCNTDYDASKELLEIGDTVTAIDREGSEYKMICLGTEYDVLRKRYINIELGYLNAKQNVAAARSKQSFPSTLAGIKRKVDQIKPVNDTLTIPTGIKRVSANEIRVEYEDKIITYKADGTGLTRSNFRKYVTVKGD